MMITVVAKSRCPVCGYLLSSLAFPSVRVNRRSIRQLPGTYLTCYPPPCPECGEGRRSPRIGDPYLPPVPCGGESYAATPWRPTAQSWREIQEYRAKRWPS